MPGVPDVFRLPIRTGGRPSRFMTIVVVAAAVVERNGRILVTKRPAGVHLEGHWEFPGGKCAPGETLEQCLVRELREELDVDAAVGAELLSTSHDYGERRIELHFFNCSLPGEPRPQLGQEMQWVERSQLGTLQFPPADAELITLLTG
jgi:8-oxo-dGTP diphosphatase